MGKGRIGCVVRGALVVFLFGVWAADARAAGEWEWTEGQGWVMGAGVSRPTPKEQLHYAYQLEQKGEYMDSARQYFLLIRNFPDSQEAGIGLQRLAKCLFEMENYYTSYKAIEQVIKSYPNTGRMTDLVEIELRVAKKMMITQSPDLLSDHDKNSRRTNVTRALEIIDTVLDHDPYGPVAAEAYLVRGEGNLYLGEIAKARTAFETVLEDFSRSEFVERARLGITRCDSLMGQAKPGELAEQIEAVREAEAERRNRGDASVDDFDDVEESIKQLAEVEAAKMMEQADQYRRMGTRATVKSSEFLYNEIIRRYPTTPQAEEALAKLGNIKIPPEQGRIAKTIRNININPFTWNKDKDPPWITPQMNPEDMVMVDDAFGPIAGVPETGLPPGEGASVRPAAYDAALAAGSGSGNFSPAPQPLGRAPAFVDGSALPPEQPAYGEPKTYSSAGPQTAPPAPPLAGAPPPPPGYGPAMPTTTYNNPLPTVLDRDLVAFDSSGGTAAPVAGYSVQQFPAQPVPYPSAPYQPAPVVQAPAAPYRAAPAPPSTPIPMPDIAPAYVGPRDPPRFEGVGAPPLTDLVGPARQNESYYQAAPAPSYAQDLYLPPSAAPAYTPPAYQAGGYDTQYAQPPAPSPYVQPAQTFSSGQGGWTLGDDFR